MSARRARRTATHMLNRGFMVVHPRWLLTDAVATNETPIRWVQWSTRRHEGIK